MSIAQTWFGIASPAACAAGTGRSCGLAPASRCWGGDTAPRCPSCFISVADVQAARRMAFRPQKPLQHPAARERIVEVQLVDPAHKRQISGAGGAWQVIDAAPADAEFLRACLLTGRSC